MGVILYYSIPVAIALIVRKYIHEAAKLKRIKELKEIDNSKIKAISNYEKKASFWDKVIFRKDEIDDK